VSSHLFICFYVVQYMLLYFANCTVMMYGFLKSIHVYRGIVVSFFGSHITDCLYQAFYHEEFLSRDGLISV